MSWRLDPLPRILGNRSLFAGSRWCQPNTSAYSTSLTCEPVKFSRCLGRSEQHRRMSANVTSSCSKAPSTSTVFHRIVELAKVYRSPSADVYRDCVFFRATPSVLGNHLEKFCRSIHSHVLFPGDEEPSDAPPSYCIDGTLRGANTTSCDYVSGDCRVEVKVSSLGFRRRDQTWGFRWTCVKLFEFDRLILVGYTPKQVIFWGWDKAIRFHRAGESTDILGGQISIGGQRNSLSWQSALRDIEKKCSWRVLHCQDISTMPVLGASPADVAYRSHPLHQLKPVARGNLYAHFCREIYSTRIFPGAQTPDESPQGICRNGSRRSQHNRTCDFISGSLRVEVKSARLSWKSSAGCWQLRWVNIKTNHFDQLLLVADSPHKITVWEWDQQSALVTVGCRTSTHGSYIHLASSVGQSCREAYASIARRIPGTCLLEVQLPEPLQYRDASGNE